MEIIKSLYEINDKQDKLSFLLQNKGEIKKAKMDMVKTFATVQSVFNVKSASTSKALNVELAQDEFFIVGNSIGFFDSHKDVSMKGSWNKTVQERGNRIPIIKDHRMIVDNLFAKNLGTSIQNITIRDLGFDVDGETEVVGAKIGDLDPYMLEKYSSGQITEHSVGLRYVQLRLAVNDPDSEDEFKVWTENIDKVINRQDAEDNGYFWPVFEQKLIEISAVVLGSNPFTPALKSLDKEPQKSTQVSEPTYRGYEFLSKLNY